MTIKETTDITGFHAHVYFDEATRGAAERLREELTPRFTVELGRWHAQPVGPHTKPMYQVAFAGDQFAAVVPWLMLNRGGLSILVHPNTDDPVADHEVNPLWLGEAVAIDVEFIRGVVKQEPLPSRVEHAGVPHE
jgi:aromatic ring-cleaving dioxygenase